MLFKELRVYLLVAVAAFVSWILADWNEEGDVTLKIAENSPDFYSSVYYKKQMDDEGLPKNELLATKMQHFKADGSTHLENPLMTLFNTSGQSPWVIKAETGIMAANGDDLQLNGSTFISRQAAKKTTALSITTSDLRVKLSNNYAETEARSEIESPPNLTSGTGMEVTFVNPIHLKLLAKVKGRYEFN